MVTSNPARTPSGAERRRHRRHRISLEARLRTCALEVLPCVIQDFSSRGMLLGVPSGEVGGSARPAAGERVELHFRLQGARARARSMVVRVTREGTTDLVGVCIRNCNAVILDHLLAIARAQATTLATRGDVVPPASETLIRELYDGLMERAMSEEQQGHGAYFYTLMALKGREDALRAQLGRVLAGEDGPPFPLECLLRPVRAVFSQVDMADTVQGVIESLLADLAADGHCAIVAA